MLPCNRVGTTMMLWTYVRCSGTKGSFFSLCWRASEMDRVSTVSLGLLLLCVRHQFPEEEEDFLTPLDICGHLRAAQSCCGQGKTTIFLTRGHIPLLSSSAFTGLRCCCVFWRVNVGTGVSVAENMWGLFPLRDVHRVRRAVPCSAFFPFSPLLITFKTFQGLIRLHRHPTLLPQMNGEGAEQQRTSRTETSFKKSVGFCCLLYSEREATNLLKLICYYAHDGVIKLKYQ